MKSFSKPENSLEEALLAVLRQMADSLTLKDSQELSSQSSIDLKYPNQLLRQL